MPLLDEWRRNPPPLKPGILAAFDTARAADSGADPLRYCRPMQVTFCADDDRSIDPTSGKQRFDMTPPADLPPPPRR